MMNPEKIDWKYFFGGGGSKTFDRYYKAEINGVRVERHDSNRGREYSIGNMDEAKKKYKNEKDLLKAIDSANNQNQQP
jgi:hypothetical protein